MVVEFFILFLLVLLVSLSVYFITGLSLVYINKSHPGSRIQRGKDGLSRAKVEILASVKSLAVSAGLLTLGYFFQLKGWGLFAPTETTWLTFAGFFVLLFILFDAWFYWGHRLLHLRPFYRWHLPHHRSVTPTAWSNDSSGAVDTLIEHGFYFFVWLVLPVPALSVFALRLFDQISGMIGHCGFEYFAGKSARKPFPFLCTLFHDLHHSKFHYNFGNFMSLWDRWGGTIYPDYDTVVGYVEQTGSMPDNDQSMT